MSYWSSRFTKELDALYTKSADEIEKKLGQLYNDTAKRLLNQIRELLLEIKTSNSEGTLLASDLYRYNRLYELLTNLNKELQKLGIKEYDLMSRGLEDAYNDALLLVGQGFTLGSEISKSRAKAVVEHIWCGDGKSLSQRIWANKAQMLAQLEKDLFDVAATGDAITYEMLNKYKRFLDSDLVQKIFKPTTDGGFFCAKRLIRTELAYVQNQAIYDEFTAQGVIYYEVVDVGDARTCESCAEEHKGIYELAKAEVGTTWPPFHPFCRCTCVPVYEIPQGVQINK